MPCSEFVHNDFLIHDVCVAASSSTEFFEVKIDGLISRIVNADQLAEYIRCGKSSKDGNYFHMLLNTFVLILAQSTQKHAQGNMSRHRRVHLRSLQKN